LAVLAQPQAAYPTRPVTFVVPFSPGGGTDIAARLLANKLGQKLGQSVVVENRPGAGGVLAADAVAKARPDGYTLLIANVGTQSINPWLYKLPYDADKAFAPISLFADLPFALVVNPAVPAKTPKELIALAKAAPEKYTYASSGNGGSPHLTAEIFQQAAGVKFTHVPYKGGGPAMADLMAGHVNMLFASILETSGYVKSGKLRALAVTSAERSPAMPDVPTLAEQGVPNAESGSWVALLAPAGTPAAIVDRLSAEVREAVATPDMRQALIAQGATPRSSTPAELQAAIDQAKDRYGRVIKARGIRVD
jgi:tripartite-type tricarboxylate transporter receptor subunit TctC